MLPLLRLMPATEGFPCPGTISVKFCTEVRQNIVSYLRNNTRMRTRLHGGQKMAEVHSGEEINTGEKLNL